MKKHLTLLSVLIIVLLLAACGNAGANGNAKTNYTLTTAGTSGSFYAIGAAITQVLNNNSESLNVTNQASGGSVENIRLLDNKEVEFALVGGDSAVGAYEGTGEFEGESRKETLRGVFSMYSQPLSLVVLKDSGISTIQDLQGKKVAVGAPGSGSEVKSKEVLEVLGLPYDTGVKQQYLSFAEAVEGMKDGQIDAAFIWAGVPVPAVQELASVRDIDLIDISEEEAAKVNQSNSAIYAETIPANTYSGIENEKKTLAVNTQIVVHADVDDEVVYEFVKQFFENIGDIHAAHESMKGVTLETAPINTIELHSGAAKYYEEQGVLNN
ncbi:TAXI family TRAP transporter solute-binding subunit [Sporosarcina sp. 179-K 3D1 HS]|uniref:TAXI family TRAP transporter solute-binding subunit n=1 Tax=Sporosarcina sp. 179-K 3D1 HS TaxID=3232169 RepID=UPI0039A245FA